MQGISFRVHCALRPISHSSDHLLIICIAMIYGQFQELVQQMPWNFDQLLDRIESKYISINFEFNDRKSTWPKCNWHLNRLQTAATKQMKTLTNKIKKNFEKPTTPLTLKMNLSSRAVTFYHCCLFVSPLKLETSMLEQFRQFIINECNCLQSA